MNGWESLVERKIREAMAQGVFENLPGKGRPVDTSENPFEDPDLRMAHRLLRNAGFAPAWMEERKDIDSEFADARRILERAWSLRQRSRKGKDSAAECSWQVSVREFSEKVGALNLRLEAYNLQVPAAVFQRRKIDIDQEIRKLVEGSKTA